MLLLAENFKIDFNALKEEDLAAMPNHLRSVAELILDWKVGKQEFLLHTSGSTSKPKPIYLQRDKIIYSAKLTARTFGLQAGDTLLCCLGTNYIAGFMMVMRALVLDCHLYVTPATGNPLTNIDSDTKLDFAAFVPLQLETIYTCGEKCFQILNKMKAVIVGGAAVSPQLEAKVQGLQVPVYHTYSMTETYTHVAIR
ncbi:MAG: AMP-binding protein, partial [Bacteroidia bacterium]